MQYLNNLLNQLRQRLHAWHQQHKERTVENNNNENIMYTEEQLMARLKFFIGICLSLTLFGIVFVVLYSLIFVTQPLNAISPIDQKFFELIVPIATFLTGTLSGIMLAGNNPDAQKAALEAANKGWDRPPSPTPTNGGNSNGGFGTPQINTPTFSTPATVTNSFGAQPLGSGGGFGGAPAAATGFGSDAGFGASAAPAPAFTASGKAIVPDFQHPEI
jgi:hypothetical protein